MSTSIPKRWSALAFGVFALTLACGLCLIALTPKVYVATAEIAVAPRSSIGIEPSRDRTFSPLDDLTFPPESEILQSKAVLQPIVTDLQLDKKWEKRFPSEAPLAHLLSHLKIELKPYTSSIDITVFSDVPTEAANIANAIADRYMTMRDVEEDQRTTRGLDALREQITQQERVFADAQAAVQKIENDRFHGKAPTEEIDVDLEKREADLLRAQEDYDARRALLERLEKQPDDDFTSSLDGLGRLFPTIAAIRADILKLQTDLSGLAENDLNVASLRAQLNAKNKELSDLFADLRRTMQIDCDMAKSRVDLLQKQVETLRAKEDSDPGFAPLHDARVKRDQAKNLLNALVLQLKQVSADELLQVSPVRILSRAEAPSHPLHPNVPLDLMFTIIVGLLLGITAASFVELLLWLRR